jgi:hypothetical protein
MQRDQVISILESLVPGQTADVVEALTTATHLLRKNDRPASAGARWTEEEDALLCREFDSGTAIRAIARQHGRSSGAITSRLVKLGKIDASAVQSRDRGARVVS